VKPIRSVITLAAGLLIGTAALAQSIVVASTTSTEQSGLFGAILPQFKQATGIDVKVVALGTGQAIDMARRGDADVLFVHDKVAEEKFVAEGFSAKRQEVMYNDFVLVGPKADPANVRVKVLNGSGKMGAAQETVDWASGAEVEGATEPDPKPNSSLEDWEVEPLVDDELPAWPGWLARARSTTAAKATAAATAARFFAPSARCRIRTGPPWSGSGRREVWSSARRAG